MPLVPQSSISGSMWGMPINSASALVKIGADGDMEYVPPALGTEVENERVQLVTEETLSEIESVVSAECIDDSEELIEAYVEEMPLLIAEIRRLWKLLDDAEVER